MLWQQQEKMLLGVRTSLSSAVRSPSIHNCFTRGATVHTPLLFLLERSNGPAIDEWTCSNTTKFKTGYLLLVAVLLVSSALKKYSYLLRSSASISKSLPVLISWGLTNNKQSGIYLIHCPHDFWSIVHTSPQPSPLQTEVLAFLVSLHKAAALSP